MDRYKGFMPKILQRTTFETPRAAEYFKVQELQAQTGQPVENFATVALKELVDNALDACESAGVAPVISIEVLTKDALIHLSVGDNGRGIPPETVDRILNFQTRTSDKSAYRAPTRGAQGNALKTVLGMPCALGSRNPVVIESMGVRHSVVAWVDPAGELRIEHDREAVSVEGTKISLTLPVLERQTFRPDHLARGFALFNPHATIKIAELDDESKQAKSEEVKTSNSYHPSEVFPGEWRKFLPTDLTSPWWYRIEDLEKLIFSHIAETRRIGKDLTLREFVRQFRGLSGTAKAKAICDRFPEIRRLSDFEKAAEVEIQKLLDSMREATKSPAPTVLGFIGEEHYRSCFDKWFKIKPNRFWYAKQAGPSPKERQAGEIPFVFEVAVAKTAKGADFFSGLNFSPTYEDFLGGTHLVGPKFAGYGIRGFLENAHVDLTRDGVAVHLICPTLDFFDRGKSHLKTSETERTEE